MNTIVIFSPREVELVSRGNHGSGQNAQVLQELALKIDRFGEAQIDPDFVARIRGAARNWKGGYEQSLKAVVAAIDRMEGV